MGALFVVPPIAVLVGLNVCWYGDVKLSRVMSSDHGGSVLCSCCCVSVAAVFTHGGGGNGAGLG